MDAICRHAALAEDHGRASCFASRCCRRAIGTQNYLLCAHPTILITSVFARTAASATHSLPLHPPPPPPSDHHVRRARNGMSSKRCGGYPSTAWAMLAIYPWGCANAQSGGRNSHTVLAMLATCLPLTVWRKACAAFGARGMSLFSTPGPHRPGHAPAQKHNHPSRPFGAVGSRACRPR